MKIQNPHYLIHTVMDEETRSTFQQMQRGELAGRLDFNHLASLYMSFISAIDADKLKDADDIREVAAATLAQVIHERLEDAGIDTDGVNEEQLAAAIAGSIGEAYDDTMTEYINEAREMQDTLTNFDNMADFEADLDKTLATTRHKLKNVFARIHGIKQESTAASTICEYIEDAIGSPTDGDSRGAADDLLAALAQDAPNKETEAVIDAARFILQGEDDGNPADTIREQLCSVVGYSTDGKTDAMLDETLEALADMATDSALTAVMQAARDILKTDATA